MRDVYTLHTPPHYTYTKPLLDTQTPPSQQDERQHHLTRVHGSDMDSGGASDEPSVPAAASTPVDTSTPPNSSQRHTPSFRTANLPAGDDRGSSTPPNSSQRPTPSFRTARLPAGNDRACIESQSREVTSVREDMPEQKYQEPSV